MSRHAVVVLAAGASTRLGQPKQLLTRAGEPLVHRAVRLAWDTSPAQVLVVLGAQAEAVRAALDSMPCTLVLNPVWREGIAGSLRAAAARLPCEVSAVLVLACDQPALEGHHLQDLLRGAEHAPGRCAATDHGPAPGVPVVVPRDWFADIGKGQEQGFAHRLRGVPAGQIYRLQAAELLLDVDTPQDLAQARARGWVDTDAT